MNRQYFYEENGKTKRYTYCSLCGKGPFRQNQIVNDNVSHDKILFVAGQTINTSIYYCYDCCSHHTNVVKKDTKHTSNVKAAPIEAEQIIEEEVMSMLSESKESSLVEVQSVSSEIQNHNEMLLKESKLQILTPLTGKWSIILLKSKTDQLYCKSIDTDPVKFTDDYNNGKIKIQGVNVAPLQLVYVRRTEKESDAKSIEDTIKKRPKLFKQNLIENYKRTIGGKK